MRFFSWRAFLGLSYGAIWASYPVVGVVVEEGTDRVVPYAEIRYTSGKQLGIADRRGRFEIQVESRNAVLLVWRAGYDTARVELQDYGDLLDVVVSLRSAVRELGETRVLGRQTTSWQALKEIPVGKLEDAAGMRFDLAEHLSQLPGFSGQRDFSSALSYDGSRSQEVAYYLGGVRVPNMRHLDVGFPGNLSVIDPHVLRGIEIHDHYGEGPANQGRAAAVRFIPDAGDADAFSLRASLGTTAREVYATGPWVFGDAFILSFRWLDAAMLTNMGEKFFTEFRKRSAACSDCNIQSGDAFDLSARDAYLRVSGSDSSGARWGIGALIARDAYAVRQDTSSDLGKVNSATIVRGHQNYSVVTFDYAAARDFDIRAGWIDEAAGDTLRDTAAFRSAAEAAGNADYRNFIDGGSRNRKTYRFGADGQLFDTGGGTRWHWVADYAHVVEERFYADSGRLLRRAESFHHVELLGRMTRRTPSSRWSLGIGSASLIDCYAVLFSLDGEYAWKETGRFFGGAAWRSDPVLSTQKGELRRVLSQGGSAKLGTGFARRGFAFKAYGFGRFYPDPELPEPPVLWHYRELSRAEYAWVSGLSASLEWRTLHHVALQSNLSSVYGEYELADRSLPWDANARFDVLTHVRVYPRSDSLLSVILTHHAAWRRPLYFWVIGDHTRSVRSYERATDLYRTDVRVNLDLGGSWKPLEKVRFYAEVNNIFEPVRVSWLRWLGTENARQRSMVTRDADGNSQNGYELVPFLAKGLGLYAQFGVEGTFGF